MKPYISVVIPVYQGANTLGLLYKRLNATMMKLKKPFELIFVDDGSSDDSWKILEGLYRDDSHIRIIQLARNFGQHNALMCGFAKSHGNIVITLDDDLQNPPEEIGKLIAKLGEGFDVVYGQYLEKKHSPFRNFGSTLVQMVYRSIFHMQGNLTSFRALKREVVLGILSYHHHFTFVDGLISWHTRRIGYVDVQHSKRYTGSSTYSFSKLLILSVNLLTNFSIVPLQVASVIGFTLSFMGLSLALFYFLKKILYDIPVTGFATIIIAVLLFSGVQLITVGIIGEYIGRIHLNINRKPQFVIKTEKERERD